MFHDVMGKFEHHDSDNVKNSEPDKPKIYFDEDEIPDEEESEGPQISKKRRKEMSKLSVAELKSMVPKPEIVDWTDASASDPRLLVHIKSYRNVVPVPSHWSLKREYLSSKRGVEKPPFSLPEFIQKTGIAEMRDSVLEKQDQQTLKQKQRERVQPKMGKLDIDYHKLYEAFFRFQTKPELTRYGEVYYEGKEYETNLRHLRPGELSNELKEALNIPPGAPPPWLVNQQRFGPPPSYPALKIPGLNAPPPPGAMWGYHPGGYGKPPVDEHNRPLYGGDIFGVLQTQQIPQYGEPIQRDLWGELQLPEEESDDDISDTESEEPGDYEASADTQTLSGFETPSGFISAIPSEIDNAESGASEFDVRKHNQPKSAFQVIPERHTQIHGFFGGDKIYDFNTGRSNQSASEDVVNHGKQGSARDSSVQMDSNVDRDPPEDLYNPRLSEQQPEKAFQEDLSDMIATESNKPLR